MVQALKGSLAELLLGKNLSKLHVRRITLEAYPDRDGKGQKKKDSRKRTPGKGL